VILIILTDNNLYLSKNKAIEFSSVLGSTGLICLRVALIVFPNLLDYLKSSFVNSGVGFIHHSLR